MEKREKLFLAVAIVCSVVLGVAVALLMPKHSSDNIPVPTITTTVVATTTIATPIATTPILTPTPKPRNIVMAERLEKVVNATLATVPKWRIEEEKRYFKSKPWIAFVFQHDNETECKTIRGIIFKCMNKTIAIELADNPFGCDLSNDSVNSPDPVDTGCTIMATKLGMIQYLKNHSFPVMILHFPNHDPEFVIIDGLDNMSKDFPAYVPLLEKYWKEKEYYGKKSY